MGIGPVPAGKAALKAAGKQLSDMDICEVCIKSLNFDSLCQLFCELGKNMSFD